MYTATITSKGQVTLPSKVREKMRAKAGDRVVFEMTNGKFVVEKLQPIDSVFGSLANPKVKPLTDRQMKKLIEKGMFSDKYSA